MVLQDDAGPGLEEPASSLQLAQLRLQEQLDARACARLCWLQMEGPYRLCRLGPCVGWQAARQSPGPVSKNSGSKRTKISAEPSK